MHHANQQRRQKRPADAAQPAGHHHDEGFHHHVHVHLQISRLTRQAQCPAQPGQAAAQRHSPQHERRGVNAQCRQHSAVCRGGAQALAPGGLGQQQVQPQPHQWPQHDGDDMPGGQKLACNFNRPFQARKARCKHLIRPKGPQHHVVHEQRQAKSGHQLVQLRHTQHTAQQQHLNHRAQRCRARCTHQHGPRVAPSTVTPAGQPNSDDMRRQHGPQHVKTAVRKVNNARHTKNQRQPRCH